MKKVIVVLLISCLAYSPLNDKNSFSKSFIKSYECDDHVHKMTEAAYCPKCGSFALGAVPGYYEVLYSCTNSCVHGHAYGYDAGIQRIYHSAYMHCTNCGYSSSRNVSAPEWVVECHGYD